jgi:dolichyl-phosphate beta-glucosyltransferase
MSSQIKAPRLSVIIPAYNESRRLPATLQALEAYLSHQNYGYEVIVVDDGSLDGTGVVVSDWESQHPNTALIQYYQNQGKGYAVQQGIRASMGEYCLIYDADGATPIQELERLWAAIDRGTYEIVIGSRALPSQTTHIKAHLHRKILGRVFTGLLRGLVHDIQDTQCGFKLFKREKALPLFARQTLKGYAFDVEILHMAQQNHYQIREIPINWADVPGSKVHVMVDSWRMFWSLFKIAWQSYQGQYRLTEKSYPQKGEVLP